MSTLKVTKKDEVKVWRDEAGRFHRVDGPALIYSNDEKRWYLHGQLHRIDGPAATFSNGDKEYWINGVKMTKEEWFQQLPQEQKIKMAFKLDQL